MSRARNAHFLLIFCQFWDFMRNCQVRVAVEILRCTDPTVTRFDIAPSRRTQCSRIALTVETRISPFFSCLQRRYGRVLTRLWS